MNLPEKYIKYNALSSLKYAVSGIQLGFKRELNLVLQLTIGIIMVGLSIYTQFWLFAILQALATGFVISIELMNTAFETLCDVVEPNKNEQIKIVKDIAAGAVLSASLGWLFLIVAEFAIIFVG
jgi:diacylglycerol kinase